MENQDTSGMLRKPIEQDMVPYWDHNSEKTGTNLTMENL